MKAATDCAHVTVIGSALVDDVHGPNGIEQFLGGAGLNLAVALSQHGVATALAASIGNDEEGAALAAVLETFGVELLLQPKAIATRHASCYVTDGEPRYRFHDRVDRRVAFTCEVSSAIRCSVAVVANSFPFEATDSLERLTHAFESSAAVRVIDPNPRPDLVGDPELFAANLDLLLPQTDIVKISQSDLALLHRSLEQILSGGVKLVLLTKGSDGAEVVTSAGDRYTAPIVASAFPPVDTIGAGDAALAGLLASALGEAWVNACEAADAGQPSGIRSKLASLNWESHLSSAMRAAAACCRRGGGPAHTRLEMTRRLEDKLQTEENELTEHSLHAQPERASASFTGREVKFLPGRTTCRSAHPQGTHSVTSRSAIRPHRRHCSSHLEPEGELIHARAADR